MAKLTKYTTGVILAIGFFITVFSIGIIALLYLVAHLKNLGV